ncbi:MAG: hypothetical protein UEP57_06650 [Oscillospiraceae bacterium]|nr:hypothetical protein [Oscillospiraceae bacterium]
MEMIFFIKISSFFLEADSMHHRPSGFSPFPSREEGKRESAPNGKTKDSASSLMAAAGVGLRFPHLQKMRRAPQVHDALAAAHLCWNYIPIFRQCQLFLSAIFVNHHKFS